METCSCSQPKTWSLWRFLGVFLLLISGPQLHAEIFWQLGTFDESSAEFSPITHPKTGRRIDYSDPRQDPVFRIGVSDPSQDWYSFQPGSASGPTGHRRHPFTIQFELKPAHLQQLRLTLGLLAYSTRLPAVQIGINGHTGLFHQAPKLAYSAGDAAVFFLPHYATATITAQLPPQFLRIGTNELTLTPLDDPDTRDDVRPSGYAWPGNSGIVYDALRLETAPDADSHQPKQVRVEPTIFYRLESGLLREDVEVIYRGHGVSHPDKVSLSVGAWSETQALKMPGEFGEARLIFRVPEFPTNSSAVVRLESGGRTEDFPLALNPKRKWEVLMVPNEHLDIGYTDHDWKVAELQARTVDDAMILVRDNPGFQFTFDGYWIVNEFLRSRNSTQREEFIRRVRSGQLHVPAVHGSTFTGFASLENLIRGLYPSRQFARQYGLPFDCALITDVPSYSWSFASVLGASGITHLAAASDAYRAPFLLYNRFHETSPHRWQGPDGQSVLTWYSRHYHQVASLFGMPPQLAQGRESLPRFLEAYDHPNYSASTVLLYGTHVENVELHPAQATLASEWNRIYAYPRLAYAGFKDAMQQIIRQSTQPPPLVRGDGGPYWEDGLGANARTTSLARRNMYRALSAEILSTLSTQLDPKTAPDRARLASLWQQLLVTDEHTWHADQSTRDPESEQSLRQGNAKDLRSVQAHRLIEEHLGQALANLGQNSAYPAGSLLLWNSLSWSRRGLLEVDVPKGQALWDVSTGEFLRGETIREGNFFQRIRFLSPELPPIGHRQLRFLPAPSSPQDPTPSQQVQSLENSFYRIEFDPASGAIRSLFDKDLRRNLVAEFGPYRFGEMLYVTGADTLPNRLVQYSTVSTLPSLTIHRAAGGKLREIRRTGFGSVAILESTNRNLPRIETEVVLLDALKRIEITYRVEKEKTYAKEAVYIAFPFEITDPQFRYATQNGYVNPRRDLLPGAGLEWFTVQNWVSVGNDQVTAALIPTDAPLITLGDVARGTWPKEFGERPGTVFSYVMNNYTPEGYLAGQGGDFQFHYVLTSGPDFNPMAFHRLGAEALAPVERNAITANERTKLRAADNVVSKQSHLEIAPPEVSLVTWKSAEQGTGTILRFLELTGQDQTATVRFPQGWRIRRAALCTAVEDETGPLSAHENQLTFPIKAFGMATVLVEFEANQASK